MIDTPGIVILLTELLWFLLIVTTLIGALILYRHRYKFLNVLWLSTCLNIFLLTLLNRPSDSLILLSYIGWPSLNIFLALLFYINYKRNKSTRINIIESPAVMFVSIILVLAYLLNIYILIKAITSLAGFNL